MWETWVQSLGQEDPLEQEMATHSSILASRIPWTEEVGGLQSTGHKEWDTTEWLHFHFHRPRSGIVGLYSKLKKKKKACMLSHVQLFATLWTIACQAPLSMELSRQKYSRGLPFPTLGDLPDPGIEPTSLVSAALASGFFSTSVTWDYIVVLFIYFFRGTSKLFSIVAATAYIPTVRAEVLPFLHFVANPVFFLMLVILRDVRYYFMVSVHISLKLVMLNTLLFMCWP